MSNSKRQALVERWDTFISKIKGRANELISQANQGTEMFILQLLFDTNAIGNAWTGIKSQIFELSNKLDNGWEKMDDLFDEADSSSNETDIERSKKEAAKTYIHWEYEKNQILALANAARQVLLNVKTYVNENKMHNCTQCGSPLNIPIYTFRAKNIKCESCTSVNSYKPDDRVIALESWVLVPLANEHSLTEKETVFFLEEKLTETDSKKVTNEQVSELISARKESIIRYYHFLVNSIPEKTEFYERQKEERLKWAENVRY